MIYDDLTIQTKEQTCIINTPYWEIKAITRPIFGSVKNNAKRIDISIKQLQKHTILPHGILGQSYDDDNIGIDGNMDEYHDGEVTTTAQAEGAIEGHYLDYLMQKPFSSHFKYSRFNATINKPRNIHELSGRKIYHAQSVESTAS